MEVEEEFFDEKYSLEETFFSCELPREDWVVVVVAVCELVVEESV